MPRNKFIVVFYILAVIVLVMLVELAYAYVTSFLPDDVTLMAHLIAAEARGEPYEGMCAVATVVMNRVAMSGYPDSIHGVIMQDGQFADLYSEVPEDCMAAAKAVVVDGYRNLPTGVDMFQRAKVDYWYGRPWFCTIGAHNFYGFLEN